MYLQDNKIFTFSVEEKGRIKSIKNKNNLFISYCDREIQETFKWF